MGLGLLLRKKPPPQPARKPPERIAITGMGMVSPLGCSTWSTALALRFRKTAWCEHETVLVADDPHGIVLRGATVSRLPQDFISPELDGAERAAALISPALHDCLAQFSPREVRGLDCRIDNSIATGREDFLRILKKMFPLLDVAPEPARVGADGALERCTFFERIMKGAEAIRKGQVQRVVVGCVDSLCATSWLMSVRDDEVLKDAINPEGIIAGEAAGAVLLERESAARQRGARVLAFVSAWGRGMERNSWNGAAPATGGGLTDAFHGAFCALGDGGKRIATVIADMNGERQRAFDWAYAEGRIFSGMDGAIELRLPAFIAGDCGAATGAVMLADALGRFAFHPRFGGQAALVISDKSGSRRVLCLERGDAEDRRQFISGIRRSLEYGWTQGGKLCRQP